MERDQDEEDFIFYGTPIEREEDTSARKRKAVADAGQLRALPSWKQEVRDEEGRRRFHGAFTGGFSAGYYNTVGSKEGWAPQTFTSSRKNRAEVKKQSIYNFLDDEDVKDMGGHPFETSAQFDTFGFTAAEVARKQAEKEQKERPSAIPGPVPDEIVLPVANSIGLKLLLKMGWRRGHSIKETRTDSLYGARREARKAFLAFSGNDGGSEIPQTETSRSDSEDNGLYTDGLYASHSTLVFVLNPKQDLHGLGYDPFKHAPEFRDRKRLRSSRNNGGAKTDISMRGNLLASNSGKYAAGFGIGALEDLDVEDEDIYASGFELVGTEIEEVEPSGVTSNDKHRLEFKKHSAVFGFRIASNSDYNLERFHPPAIPSDFEPLHKFSFPLESVDKSAESPPQEVSPPEDNNLRMLIDGFSTLVARCGKQFEDISKEKNKSNVLFSFLNGGNGHSYYVRKLWEAKQRNIDQQNQVDMKSVSSDSKMTAESRGRILGEKPLERSSIGSSSSVVLKEVIHLQANLSDTFTEPSSVVEFSESAKPFINDPAKQARFEQFLKDKYQGGLRSTYSGGTTSMSETDRARERLDFEATAEAIQKGKWSTKPPSQQLESYLGTGDGQFVSAGAEEHRLAKVEDKMEYKILPKREEFQWRPSPILCKRFDIIDPYMGKPPPMPRARSKMDSLIFMPNSIMNAKGEESGVANRDLLSTSQAVTQETGEQLSVKEPDIEPSSTNVQRPVDLYKAIFSDDSDDEEGNASFNQVDDPEKKTEGVNTTLNRLIAGDFLESLGKELGLQVPLDEPYTVNKTSGITSFRETDSRADVKISSRNGKSASTPEIPDQPPEEEEATNLKLSSQEIPGKSASLSKINPDVARDADPADGGGHSRASFWRESPNANYTSGQSDVRFSNHRDSKVQAERKEHRKHRSHWNRSSFSDSDSSSHRGRSNSRSEKHRKHRGHQNRNSSDSDSSSHRGRSNSRAEKRVLPEGNSRKLSDHRKYKRSRSPTRYSSHSDDERERTHRDRRKHGHRKHR